MTTRDSATESAFTVLADVLPQTMYLAKLVKMHNIVRIVRGVWVGAEWPVVAKIGRSSTSFLWVDNGHTQWSYAMYLAKKAIKSHEKCAKISQEHK